MEQRHLPERSIRNSHSARSLEKPELRSMGNGACGSPTWLTGIVANCIAGHLSSRCLHERSPTKPFATPARPGRLSPRPKSPSPYLLHAQANAIESHAGESACALTNDVWTFGSQQLCLGLDEEVVVAHPFVSARCEVLDHFLTPFLHQAR